jgi:outer membrane protein OmpA-like peptidoglycan-associated protein
MKPSTVPLHLVAAALCSALAAGAQAQPIFRGQDITEDKLIEALTPEPGEIRTRSIRVERDQASARSGDKPAAGKKAGASLLITFVTNSSELTADAQSKLDIVARALQAEKLADFRFAVEGHADPRGRHDYNLRLSQARAESVVDYLTTRHRIERDRLKPVGKGDTEPANTARPAAPENRRVTILTVRD